MRCWAGSVSIAFSSQMRGQHVIEAGAKAVACEEEPLTGSCSSQRKDAMNEVNFIDTTLRDGQMSLWATGMRTDMILPVAATMDQAGFAAIEIMATRFEKKMVRELREDPWERIDLVRQRIQKTPLRMIRSIRSQGTNRSGPTAHSKDAAAHDPGPVYGRLPHNAPVNR